MPPSDEHAARLERIETKLDRLGEGMERLARIEERQTAHLDRQARLEERQDALDGRVQKLEAAHHSASPIIGLLKMAAAAVIGALTSFLFGHPPTN